MSDYGPAYGMEKYDKMAKEEDALEADTSAREEQIEEATTEFDAASENLTPELKEIFQAALDSAETYYDLDPTLASEILESAQEILKEFSDRMDETEVEEKAQEFESDIETLKKMTTKLENKSGAVH